MEALNLIQYPDIFRHPICTPWKEFIPLGLNLGKKLALSPRAVALEF